MKTLVLFFVYGVVFMIFGTILNMPIFVSYPNAHVVGTMLLVGIVTLVFLRGNWAIKLLLFSGCGLGILAGHVFVVDKEDGIFLYIFSICILTSCLLLVLEHLVQAPSD